MDRTKEQIMRWVLFSVLLVVIISCKREVINVSNTKSAAIEHLVFFSMKDGLAEEEISNFKNSLMSLAEIEGIITLKISEKQDVGDPRALDYDIVMSVQFEAISYLNTYAEHPHHLKVRESLMKYLAGPPATLDLIPE